MTVSPAPLSSKLRWFVLAIGAGLLALLLASGILAGRFLRELYAQQQKATGALATRTQMLSALWVSVQNYNDAVRQFMVRAKADQDQAAKRRLDQLTLKIQEDLTRYPVDRDSMEAALLAGIEGVISQQRTLYVTVLEEKPRARRAVPDQISQRMAALQQEILDWSNQLQAWNSQRLRQADESLASKFGALQQGLSRALAIGCGSGVLLVLVGMGYIVRLERQTRRRYVQLAHSQEELQRLSSRLLDAQESERRSISRELHDEIGQALGALLVDIGRLSTARPELSPQLEKMKSVTEGTVQSVRNMALLLRPSMLDDLGLEAAVEWQGREVSRRSEMEVTVESESVPEDLPDEYRVCIYRLVQEALNNSVRHSGARNAKVRLGCEGGAIVVQVSDDGRGFAPGRVRGLGLLGMEERVKRLGGTLHIDSQPGHGAAVTARLPYPPARTEAA